MLLKYFYFSSLYLLLKSNLTIAHTPLTNELSKLWTSPQIEDTPPINRGIYFQIAVSIFFKPIVLL